MAPRLNSLHRSTTRGFSLVELLISMVILVTVTAAIFERINQMQKSSASEAMKLDMEQQAREFVDQTVRDLHMTGYPNLSMYSTPSDLTKIAVGLVRVSPTSILLEGDVNSDGNVYSVNIYYVPADPSDPNCPCVRRSAVVKVATDSLAQPTASSYTETPNVVPPGVGAGLSGEDLFTFYDASGKPVPGIGTTGVDISMPGTPSGQEIISSISTVKINLTMLSNVRDPVSGGPMGTSLSGTAKVGQ